MRRKDPNTVIQVGVVSLTSAVARSPLPAAGHHAIGAGHA
jgi:hypothetical protein